MSVLLWGTIAETGETIIVKRVVKKAAGRKEKSYCERKGESPHTSFIVFPQGCIEAAGYAMMGSTKTEELPMTADLKREIERAAEVVLRSKYVVAVIGAGMSVESGIPPFRGPGGLWTKYGEPPMDGYQRFLADPKGWWETYQQQTYRMELDAALRSAKPNPGHYALAKMERMGILKYIITQNVDNLHQMAGSKNIAEIHGNRYKLRCISCGSRFDRAAFEIKELPPHCPVCNGIVKGDGVMFGEPIPIDTLETCQREAARCDCMFLVGTSGTVYPAAGFPLMVKQSGGSLIEVNLYETSLTEVCDVVLSGPSGESLPLLVESLKESK